MHGGPIRYMLMVHHVYSWLSANKTAQQPECLVVMKWKHWAKADGWSDEFIARLTANSIKAMSPIASHSMRDANPTTSHNASSLNDAWRQTDDGAVSFVCPSVRVAASVHQLRLQQLGRWYHCGRCWRCMPKIQLTIASSRYPATVNYCQPSHDDRHEHSEYQNVAISARVSQILSLISQNLNRSRDSEQIPFGSNILCMY